MSLLVLGIIFCFLLAAIFFSARRNLPPTFFASKTFPLILTAQDLRLPFSFVFHPNRWNQWLSIPLSYHQLTSATYRLLLDGKPYLLTMDRDLSSVTIAPICSASTPHALWHVLLRTDYKEASLTSIYAYPRPSLSSFLLPKEASFDPVYLIFLKDLPRIFSTIEQEQ